MAMGQKNDLSFQAQNFTIHTGVLQINYPDRQANLSSLNLVVLKLAI